MTTFRTELAPGAPQVEESDDAHNLPIGGHVNADEAREALKNPHVAKVVEAFKGQIVGVERGAKPAPDA